MRADGTIQARVACGLTQAEVDAAHVGGLYLTGYQRAIEDISARLAEEIQRLEDESQPDPNWWKDGNANVPGLRRALAIVKEAGR